MKSRTSRLSFVVMFVALASGGTAFGDPITIFNTGQSSGGTALPTGMTDPHYSLISAPAGVAPSAITTVPNAVWVANQTTADWISPGASGGSSWPVGNYDFQTTFNLTGLIPSTAELSGKWTSDNNGCIFLNGTNTGDCVGFASFGSLSSFSITSGFISGVNTLDFVVTNGGGPTGVIAEVSGTASTMAGPPPSVPEPGSLALLATGLLGVVGVVRRRSLA